MNGNYAWGNFSGYAQSFNPPDEPAPEKRPNTKPIYDDDGFVDHKLMAEKWNRTVGYQQAVGDNIRGGIFGSIGYLVDGERGSFVGAGLDNAISVGTIIRPAQRMPSSFKAFLTAEEVARDYAILESMKPGKPSFRVVSIMEGNGIFSLGKNGKPFPTNLNPNLGLAPFSTRPYGLLQCAEPKALNFIMNLGIPKSSISAGTFSLKSQFQYKTPLSGLLYKGGSGNSVSPIAPCSNCNILLQGTKGRK